MVIAATGVGPRNAARAADPLCAEARPELLVGAGVAGALSEDLGVGDIFVARRVLDAAGDAPPPDPQLTARASAMPGSRTGTLVSVERPLVTVSEKAVWGAQVDAPAAVDMESAAWARAAAEHGIPYVVIRAVSDGARDELPGYLSRCMDRHGGIRRWRAPRPDPRQFGAVASNQNNNGPTVDAASKRLRELARDSRPGTSPSMYRRLRRVILFAIHALYGARATAVRQLRVRDYIPTFVWNDGTIGPALRTHPGKTWDRETPHYLPVPRELAEWIERWLTLTDRQPSDGEAPLFPAKKPRAGQPDTFLTQLGHYAAVAGTTTSLALLPKTDDPHDGWHPHAYHLAVKLAVRAATQLKARDPGHLTHIHPDEFARAVVAHKLASDVTSIYRDLDRQELCQAVIPEMWQILYGDGALRKGPDPDRVLKARQNLDTISTAIDSLTRDARHHEAKAEHLAQRAHSSRDDQRKLALLLEATHHTATARAHRDELVSAHAHRLDAERDLDHALNAHVPIPDQLTDEDHAVLLADRPRDSSL